jgi:tripartite ATP-independent transporter DctM subunit
MNEIAVGFTGVGLLFLLFLVRMPVAFAMGLVGFLGIGCIDGFDIALSVMGTIPFRQVYSYSLSVVPLFVLMGFFAFYSGISRDLFDTAYKWLGRLPGGVAMATLGACTGFAAACGSNTATAATMATIAMPEMKRFNYDMGFAGATVAAGATLGILIPPSVILILYGMLVEQSIGKLFMAGILPGVLLSALMILAVFVQVRLAPKLGPKGPPTSFKEKILSLRGTVGMLVLFLLVIGGIFKGLFTPTEGGGIGAFGAFMLLVLRKQLNWQNFRSALAASVRTVGMIFMLVIGAFIFGYFMALCKIPMTLANFVTALSLPPYLAFSGIMFVYLILGCFIESLALFLLTTPIFYPVVVEVLHFDPIWFGVMMVMVVSMAVITPPVGINVFIVQGVTGEVSMMAIFGRIYPLLAAMTICVILLIIFPEIALFLPSILE